ncbi:MAG: RNA-binding domain-containing protein [Bacteroidales bacterium]|jgi:ATP-dependent DNA helicase RecG
MNKSELIEKLSDIEWEDFEVKEAKSEVPKNSWETVSAFSNTAGGWLVFGVKQSGKHFEITGVDNIEKVENDFITTLRSGKFNVIITPSCKRYKFDKKNVLAFYFPISEKRPVYFNSQSNTFIRTGSGDQRATKEEIDAMFRNQSYGTKDKELTKYTIKDLHKSSLESYREYLKSINPSHHYNNLKTDEFLEKLHVLRDGKVTIGGLLVFGKYDVIEDLITDFRVDYIEVPGTSYSDSEVRFTYRINEEENLYQYFFSIMSRLGKKIELPFKLTNIGMATDNQPQMVAIREALVNLLIHSDYFSTMKPRIRTFTDRIEFMNPGGLPKDIESIIKEDYTQPRNPIIARIFRVIKLAETAGSGFDKMFKGWKTYYNSKPVIEGAFDYYKITFTTQKKKSEVKSKVKSEVKSKLKSKLEIMELIKANKEITISEIAVKLGFSKSGIEKQITKLKEEGILKRIGPDKGGHWKIIEKN